MTDEYRERILRLSRQQQEKLKEKLLRGSAEQRSAPAVYPASATQKLMWLNSRLEPASPAYNNAACVRLRGPLDTAALERALQAVAARHTPLRSVFEWNEDEAGLNVKVTDAPLRIARLDLGRVAAELRETEAKRLAVEAARRPFDLESGPVFRIQLIRLDDDDHLLTMTMHHIVSDGWSFRVLFGELVESYRALRRGAPLPGAPLQRTFHDHVQAERLFERSQAFRDSLERWRRRLADAPSLLELPCDRPRPRVRTSDGARLSFSFSDAAAGALHRLCGGLGSTPFVAAYAIFVALLARYSRQPDLCVGTPLLNRDEEAAGIIGLLINVVVLRARVRPDEPFRALLARLSDVVSEAFDDGRVPLTAVLDAVAPARNPAFTPLYQVLFMMNNAPDEAVTVEGLRMEPVDLDLGTAQTDLAVSVRLGHGQVSGHIDYRPDLFDRASIEQLAAHWERLTASAFADPERPVGRLDLLGPAERRQLEAWSGSGEPPADEPAACVHQLVLARAAAAPEAVAVRAGGVDHTYADLVAASGAVAATLVSQGVQPGEPVALCARRSFATVAGLLGILRAGGAYLPIPGDTPAARAASMLRRAACAVALCQPGLRGGLPPETRVVDLDEAAAARGARPLGRERLEPGGACYILFTSGSTGEPKGVVVPHHGVAARLRAIQRAYPMTPGDRVLQTTSIGFDVSVLEIFGTLAAGATLLLLDERESRTPQRWVETLESERATVLFVVPSWLQLLLATAGDRQLPHLRQIMTIGEVLPRGVVDEAHRRSPAVVVNAYGPTEAIIVQTVHTCDRAAAPGPVPIGRPFGDAAVRLVDGEMNLVPAGVEGEIWLGGPSLADGYAGAPELTAERFVSDPFSDLQDARLYRTGDRASWSRDGVLRFHGRTDLQVKLNGYRIELEEIGRVLSAHSAVRECAVVLQGGDAEARLVAFVAVAPEVPVTDEALREHLARELPSYMLPSRLVRRAALPLTANGKVDRNALAGLVEAEPASPAPAPAPSPAAAAVPAPSPVPAEQPQRQPRLADWFYRPAWRRLGAPPAPPRLGARVLLLADPHGVGRWLAQELRSRGDEVACVYAGEASAVADGGDLYVDLRRPDGCAELCEHLAARSFVPDTLVHLWPLTDAWRDPAPPEARAREIGAALERDYLWLAEAVLRIAERLGGAGLRAVIGVSGLHAVHESEVSSPAAAPLLGAVRVLPRELAGVTCRLVDLDPADRGRTAAWGGALLAELAAGGAPDVIALRGGARWERAFVRAPLGPQAEANALFRPRGTYLITGGLGSLGLEMADFLSTVCQANLVLVSRRPPAPREEWPRAADARQRALAQRIQRLEDRGSQVLVVAADVADRAALEAAVAGARGRFGAIHGVIHAAGATDHALLGRRDRAGALRVLSPKVHGTLHLLDLLANESSLDFVALFSSTAAQLGGVGALDYCAANNFLDCVANSRRRTRPRVVSIDWGLWGEVGAAAEWRSPAALSERYQELLAAGITRAEGVQAFVRALVSEWPQVIVSPPDLSALLDRGYDLLADLSAGARPAAAPAPPPAAEKPPAPAPREVRKPSGAEDLEAAVAEIWRDVLQIPHVGPDDNFFELGGHSLLLVTVTNRMAKRFGRLVPLARIQGEPTVAACARALGGG